MLHLETLFTKNLLKLIKKSNIRYKYLSKVRLREEVLSEVRYNFYIKLDRIFYLRLDRHFYVDVDTSVCRLAFLNIAIYNNL